MNNFHVVHLIDGILGRLHAVSPSWEKRKQGPSQWLYICEPKNSYEFELVQHTTRMSAPTFPPSEKRLGNGSYQMDDGSVSSTPPPPKLANGAPFPKLKEGQVQYSVDWHVVQALSGLRAVLLVLFDSCSLCAADDTFVGNLPLTDSVSVLVEMKTWSQDDFVPNAKYWKDWPLARFLRNPFPPKPKSWTKGTTSPLFSGETASYFLRLATYPDDRENSFAFYRAVYGISQSKRGFATVPDCYIQKTLEKHRDKLSTPPASEPDLVSLKIFADTFFKGFRCARVFSTLPSVEGSTKASVENIRAHGGARALLQGLSQSVVGYDQSGDHFVGFRTHNTPQVFEERGAMPLTPDEWKQLARNSGPELALELLDAKSVISLEALYQRFPEAKALPIARVAEVVEPLKVRLVTAMDAVRSHVARPVQASLFKYLRTFPCFRLIGETISESILHDLVSEDHSWNNTNDILFQYGEQKKFVSGDYSAATDGLDIRVTKTLAESALEHLDPDDEGFESIILSILFEQVLVYPPHSGLPPVVQKNGQLMGSVLSFPFLCLANLFAYAMAQPNAQEIIRSVGLIRRLPVLINGDDILFRATTPQYETWLRSINTVGFVPSVGKNFFHRRFLTVNSVPIEYRPSTTPVPAKGTPWIDIEEDGLPFLRTKVPKVTIGGFLNVGLLTGQAKLTGRENLGALPLSGWHAGSVIAALNPSQAHKWFLKYHKADILEQTRHAGQTLNIFAHPLLGGLGFMVPEGVEPRFSPEQRRIARALFLSASYTYEGQEKDFALKSLVFLESDLTTPNATIGHTTRRVEVELYPTGTPLPEGYLPFVDQSGVQPLAMVRKIDFPDNDLTGLRSRCRLSSNRIRSLTKRFDETVELHPVEEMTSFPYTPVRVRRSEPEPVDGQNRNNASTFVDRVFTRVYAPTIPFQDVVVPIPLSPVIEAVLEDWETSDITLVAPKPVLPSLRSLRNHEGSARRAAEMVRNRRNRGLIA